MTNFSVNKKSKEFVSNIDANDDQYGNKWSLKALKAKYKELGIDSDAVFSRIKDIIVKTLLMAWPHLEHNYKTCCKKNNRQCFQILGYDIMLDKKLKPWLLEVNESPSFNDDTDVDRQIKSGLIEDTFRLLDIKKIQKQRILEKDFKKSVVHRNNMQHMNNEEIQQAQEKEEIKDAEQQRKFERF